MEVLDVFFTDIISNKDIFTYLKMETIVLIYPYGGTLQHCQYMNLCSAEYCYLKQW